MGLLKWFREGFPEPFQAIQQKDERLSREIVQHLLEECSKRKDLAASRRVHSLMVTSRLDSNPSLSNHLIRLYGACGSLLESYNIFCKLPNPSIFSWNSIIAAHVNHGEGERGLSLYYEMKEFGVQPDRVTFLSALKACSSLGAIEKSKQIHYHITIYGLDSHVMVGNTLVDTYAKCGSLVEAQKVFHQLPNRTVISWGAIIAGSAMHGCSLLALEFFEKMQDGGIKPNNVIFLSILKACGNIRARDQGRLIHEHIIQNGFESDGVIGNTLVDMYAKCGSLEEAYKVFENLKSKDVVSWDAMIAGYAIHGHGFHAFTLYEKMQREGLKPKRVTFLCILKACGNNEAIQQSRLMHAQIIKSGLELDLVIGNTLIDTYAKCGKIQEAHSVFDKLPNRDVVSWGALITGYSLHEHGILTLELFQKLQEEGIKPSKVIFLCTLKVCGSIGAINQGRQIHHQIIEGGLDLDMDIGNTIVDMYAKCGSLEAALKVFQKLPNLDVVSWGAIIAGYSLSGNWSLAAQSLKDMQQQGFKPGDVIFTSILNACSHAGLAEEGWQQFRSMIVDHGIAPSIEHYSCMIDILGRVGRLKEAEDLLQNSPLPPDIIIWRSLLTSCRAYSNLELARQCFTQIIQLDPKDASGYVLMSSIYADAHMWDDSNRIHEMRRRVGAWKKPGRAWIETHTKVHEFFVEGKRHSQSDDIYTKLHRLNQPMKSKGFVPQLDNVLEDLDEFKEDALCSNCWS